MRYALFYDEGRELPGEDVARIRHNLGATVVSENPTRLVIEANTRAVDKLLESLPGWVAAPVTTAHVPRTLPPVRAPSRVTSRF